MRYRQHRLEWWGRRARRLLRRIFTRSYVKQQRAYRVELGGATLKRLVVADSRRAEVLAANLRSFAHSPAVPGLVARFENEVWAEFLEGRALEADDPRVPAALAKMLATLSAEEPRRCDPRELGIDREVRGDLRLLPRAPARSEKGGVLRRPARCAPPHHGGGTNLGRLPHLIDRAPA